MASASLKATPKDHVPLGDSVSARGQRVSPGTYSSSPRAFPTLGPRHALLAWLTQTQCGVPEIALATEADTLGLKSWLRAIWLSELQENYFISRSPGCPPAQKGADVEGLNEAVMCMVSPAQLETNTKTLSNWGWGRGRRGDIPCPPACPSTHPVPRASCLPKMHWALSGLAQADPCLEGLSPLPTSTCLPQTKPT